MPRPSGDRPLGARARHRCFDPLHRVGPEPPKSRGSRSSCPCASVLARPGRACLVHPLEFGDPRGSRRRLPRARLRRGVERRPSAVAGPHQGPRDGLSITLARAVRLGGRPARRRLGAEGLRVPFRGRHDRGRAAGVFRVADRAHALDPFLGGGRRPVVRGAARVLAGRAGDGRFRLGAQESHPGLGGDGARARRLPHPGRLQRPARDGAAAAHRRQWRPRPAKAQLDTQATPLLRRSSAMPRPPARIS